MAEVLRYDQTLALKPGIRPTRRVHYELKVTSSALVQDAICFAYTSKGSVYRLAQKPARFVITDTITPAASLCSGLTQPKMLHILSDLLSLFRQ